jgi:hypothetical protein
MVRHGRNEAFANNESFDRMLEHVPIVSELHHLVTNRGYLTNFV